MKKVTLDLKKLQLKKEKIADMVSLSGGMGSGTWTVLITGCNCDDDPPPPTGAISCAGTCGLGCTVQTVSCQPCG